MSSLCELPFEYREAAGPVVKGPLERLWHAAPAETVFLSATELEERERAAYERGLQEGVAAQKDHYAHLLVIARAAVSRAVEEFRAERSRYFAAMEAEVVRLALAAARRVLGREVTSDPATLASSVRAVLERLEAGSRVQLLVPEADVELWKRSLEEAPGAGCEIEGSGSLAPGECRLRFEMGSIEFDLGERMEYVEGMLREVAEERAGGEPRESCVVQ